MENSNRPQLDPILLELQLKNARLMRANQQLCDRLSGFDLLLQSRGFRYLERLEREVMNGDASQRLRFLCDLGHELVSTVTARLAKRPLDRSPSDEDEDARFVRTLTATPGQLRIALSSFGGMGDALWTSTLVEAIKRKYPRSALHVFVYERGHADIFTHNPYVFSAYLVDRAAVNWSWRRLMHEQLRRGALDIWYDCRYATRVHYGACCPVDAAEREKTARAFAAVNLNFDEWPIGNNLMSLHARRRGSNLLQLSSASAALTLEDDAQLFVYPTMEDAALLPTIEGLGDYVTVHHGADTHFVKNGPQTKNWFRERWEKVIAQIVATHGLKVVQLGTDNEQPLVGAEHQFIGRTNAHETALILAGARFHMDTEGGLVHLARATHTPSLVLFGPTPLDFFGYLQNLNYKTGDCHDCWWSTDDWQARCPRGLSEPACMSAIEPIAVLHEVDTLIALTVQRACKATVAEIAFIDESQARSYVLERVRAGLGNRRGLRVVEIASGTGELARDLATDGHRAQLCMLASASGAHDSAVLVAAEEMPMRYGSPFNLPYDTASAEAVVSTLPLEGPYASWVLRERLRLLKPGGVFVGTLAVADQKAASAVIIGMLKNMETRAYPNFPALKHIHKTAQEAAGTRDRNRRRVVVMELRRGPSGCDFLEMGSQPVAVGARLR